jgi:hypothetical protein
MKTYQMASRAQRSVQPDHAALWPEVRSAHRQMEPTGDREGSGLAGFRGSITEMGGKVRGVACEEAVLASKSLQLAGRPFHVRDFSCRRFP